jgi:hypothetical protein
MECNKDSTDVKSSRRLPRPSARFRAQTKRDERKVANTLDLKKLRAWAEVGCTLEEIAGLLGITPEYLRELKRTDYAIEEAILTGCANLKQSLRSVQVREAMRGNPTMLIWLGKQLLGQSDKQEVKTDHTINITLQEAMRELRDLSKDDLLQIRSIVDKNNATEAEYEETDNSNKP